MIAPRRSRSARRHHRNEQRPKPVPPDKSQPGQETAGNIRRRQGERGKAASHRAHRRTNQSAQRKPPHESLRYVCVLRAHKAQHRDHLGVCRQRRVGRQRYHRRHRPPDQHQRKPAQKAQTRSCLDQWSPPAGVIIKHSPRCLCGQPQTQPLGIEPVTVFDDLDQTRNGKSFNREIGTEPWLQKGALLIITQSTGRGDARRCLKNPERRFGLGLNLTLRRGNAQGRRAGQLLSPPIGKPVCGKGKRHGEHRQKRHRTRAEKREPRRETGWWNNAVRLRISNRNRLKFLCYTEYRRFHRSAPAN